TAVEFVSLAPRRAARVVERWSGYCTRGRGLRAAHRWSVAVVSGLTESSTGRVTQAVSYQPTGLSMTLSPTVLDEVVRLGVGFEDRSVVGGSTSTTPVFETRSLQAEMELCFGCVSVISSLDDSTTDKSRESFLGLIPLGSSKLDQKMKLIYVAYVRERERPSDNERAEAIDGSV